MNKVNPRPLQVYVPPLWLRQKIYIYHVDWNRPLVRGFKKRQFVLMARVAQAVIVGDIVTAQAVTWLTTAPLFAQSDDTNRPAAKWIDFVKYYRINRGRHKRSAGTALLAGDLKRKTGRWLNNDRSTSGRWVPECLVAMTNEDKEWSRRAAVCSIPTRPLHACCWPSYY